MKIEQLHSELGACMGLANMHLDDAGMCRLVFDGTTNVDLERDPHGETTLLLHAALGSVPPEGKQALYLRLLGGNYLARETLGHVLAVDADAGEVVLCGNVDVENADVKILAEVLTTFVQTAQEWSRRIDSASHGMSATVEAGAPQLTGIGMIRV